MEKLLLASVADGGLAGILLALCVLLTFNVLGKVAFFLWNMKLSKDKLSEEGIKRLTEAMSSNTAMTEKNTEEIVRLEQALAEIPKLKLDVRRAFVAIKEIAGEDWPHIRKEIMEDITQ